MDAASTPRAKSKPRLVACRECHRSKLKCDRSYPCKSCIKRGCADICPDGTLVATKRQKSAIEASQLREKTASMADRIHQLEDALALAHAKTSTEVHALLLPPENGNGMGDHAGAGDAQGAAAAAPNNDVIDAFGTLSIGSDGRSKYHNQSAGADYFAEAESPDVPTAGARAFLEGGHAISLPPDIMQLAALFPFGPSGGEGAPCAKEDVLAFLPSPETAWGICDMFFSHGDWLFDAISRAEFMDQIYSHIYSTPPASISVDKLSLLFMVLALGTLLDLTKAYDIRRTEPFYQLGRAAFCLEPLIEAATIPTIQALHLKIVYLYMTDRQTVEHRWLNMGLIAKLTYSSGLHRDSEHWIRDDPAEIERRRKLFWEVYAYDAWISFIMGRPPSFNLAHVQCRLPADKDSQQFINDKGQPEPSFHKVWKYQYRTQCLVPVVEEAFGARARGDGRASLSLSMQRYMLFCEKETSLLYLHRTFFAQAVCDCPENPLESKYATSVSATYRSACLIVAGTHDATVRHPELAARLWFLWSNLFSAAIVLGSIVTRSPACQLSASAMNELDLACNLMEQRAASGRSAKAVPILRRLRDKARGILTQLSHGALASVDKASPQSNTSSTGTHSASSAND
ncbi:fungal-specific transcription factor domain-containing protein, partial [Gautieria morchelliformis]